MAAAAACVTFTVAAQTTGSRSNPPMPSPPNAVVPNPDSVSNAGNPSATGTTQSQTPTTNTGNAGTDPAMKPGTPVSPKEAPGATPGTAGTESGSTDLTQTEPESTSGRTTRTN